MTRFEDQNTLVFGKEGGVYVVGANTPAARTLAERVVPPSASVRTPAGKPVFDVFKVSPDAARDYLGSLRLKAVDADIGRVVAIKAYEDVDLLAGTQSRLGLVWDVKKRAFPAWPDLKLFGHLVDGGGAPWSRNPDLSPYPVPDWEDGDVVLSWFDLDPPSSTPLGGYWLEIGFYEPYIMARPQVYEGDRELGATLRLGPIKVRGATQPVVRTPLGVYGEDEISLGAMESQGNEIKLIWRALKRPTRDYTVFIHALDAEGRMVAQHDGRPQAGSYPTDRWEVGEVIQDLHVLDGKLASAVKLEVGLYARPSLERLRATAPDGAPNGDALMISLPRPEG
ncbi:MAG: hypothetical protein EXR58_03520 [Chloroflexi bacterium]|nr:hypothetical protein [Chloroflexota bacterium]